MYELILMLFFGGLLFWLLILTDWYFHEPKGFDRTIWFLLIVMLNVAGAFAYLCVRYRDNRKKFIFSSEYNATARKDSDSEDNDIQCAKE